MPSILDLYSGCGGFSLGAHQAGYTTELAIDLDPLLSSSFLTNFPKARILHRDMRSVDRGLLKEHLPRSVDGVIGGPPCQAFSEIGRRDAKDPRRTLVRHFFRVVSLVNPKFFVFENVRGLGFPSNIHLLEQGLELLPRKWKVVGPVVINAADLGAPTRRLRLFAFGFNSDEMDVPDEEGLCRKTRHTTSVGEAIGDLISAGMVGYDPNGFDIWKYDRRRVVSDYAKKLTTKSGRFTGHRRTEHTRSTLKRFSKLAPGENDPVGKYHRLSWHGLSPTLRAGTGNDRGSYQAVRPIHPVEDRVITPREAARLQGFPDDFVFHPTVWHSCRMIGNSVSPVVAKVLLRRIAKHL